MKELNDELKIEREISLSLCGRDQSGRTAERKGNKAGFLGF